MVINKCKYSYLKRPRTYSKSGSPVAGPSKADPRSLDRRKRLIGRGRSRAASREMDRPERLPDKWTVESGSPWLDCRGGSSEVRSLRADLLWLYRVVGSPVVEPMGGSIVINCYYVYLRYYNISINFCSQPTAIMSIHVLVVSVKYRFRIGLTILVTWLRRLFVNGG